MVKETCLQKVVQTLDLSFWINLINFSSTHSTPGTSILNNSYIQYTIQEKQQLKRLLTHSACSYDRVSAKTTRNGAMVKKLRALEVLWSYIKMTFFINKLNIFGKKM